MTFVNGFQILALVLAALAVHAETPGRDFTIMASLDTQFYAEPNAAIFQAQADWIIAKRTNPNIVYVAHLGDITDGGDNETYQWYAETTAFCRLLNPMLAGLPDGIPTAVVPGNYDHVGGTKLYNQLLGPSVSPTGHGTAAIMAPLPRDMRSYAGDC